MPTDDDSIVFYSRAGRGFLRREVRLRAEMMRAEVANGRPFTCLLTDDRELRRLNREFLDKDYPTDVLSFPSGDEDATAALGEMAISVDRAREQAAERGHSIEQEIGVLMLHGLLHLLGLDHERDRSKMARTERHWREALGLPAGLIERVKK